MYIYIYVYIFICIFIYIYFFLKMLEPHFNLKAFQKKKKLIKKPCVHLIIS